MNKIELLAPAGNLEKAKTAILYGADAVYIGGQQFSLRSRASNFSLDQIQELCTFAKEHNAKVHVTVNILPHPSDLDGIKDYLLALDEAGVDAIIAASPSILKLAKSLPVSFECHVSTQHSTTNPMAARFWKEQGMDRVVLSRECSLPEVEEACRQDILPVEVFIHGGMCISYSGRCVLSNHMTNRDANRGGCAQSCRWKYELKEDGELISDPNQLFSMSSRDLMAVDYIEDLIKMGAASLKIEGRMKSAYYLATVVSAYRRLIDHIYETGHADAEFLQGIRNEIAKAENRPAGPGFYGGLPDESMQLYRNHSETVTQEYVAQVLEADKDGRTIWQVKNYFDLEDPFELFGPNTEPLQIEMKDLRDENGIPISVCRNPMAIVSTLKVEQAEPFAMLRRRRQPEIDA